MEALAGLRHLGLCPPETSRELRVWLDDIGRIPAMPVDPRLLNMAFTSSDALVDLGALLDTWQDLSKRICALFKDHAKVEPSKVSALLSGCEELGIVASLSSLTAGVAACEAELAEFADWDAQIQRICRRMGVEGPLSVEEALTLLRLVLALWDSPIESLSARTQAMSTNGCEVAVARAEKRAEFLRQREADMAKLIDVVRAKLEYSPQSLFGMADNLARGGVLVRFHPDVHRAETTWRRLSLRSDLANRQERARKLRELGS